MNPRVHEETDIVRASGAISWLNLLLGVWFFSSPWIFGAYTSPNAWNAWITGALIVLFAAIRIGNPGNKFYSWLNTFLGVWIFASPWIFGYTGNTGRFVDSLCVGVIVFLVSISAWGSHTRTMTPQPR